MQKSKEWFLDRINKRIYRNSDTCNCDVCDEVYNNGLVISDENHADYVWTGYLISNDEGFPLDYFDTIVERDFFENSINNCKHE